MAAILGAAVVVVLYPPGYFGPISSRVRGLFVKHTKTGNPLVDSVAEHQAAKPEAYEQYLGLLMKLAPVGFGMVAIVDSNDASSFLLVYGMATYFFSHKMVRLILLTALIACVFGGIVVGRVAGFCVEGILGIRLDAAYIPSLIFEEEMQVEATVVNGDRKDTDAKKKKQPKAEKEATSANKEKTSIRNNLFYLLVIKGAWLYLAYYLYQRAQPYKKEFQDKCREVSYGLSHPIANTQQGVVTVDDYREAYWWLRDNTPEDARIMAWWDYGYQITAIAKRTTIADGNTWNHERIALLGRALTSPLKEGHLIARHLADYVLLWTGGGGDDVTKSPHLARILPTVYTGTWCGSGQNRFKEVYKSKYGKVRIYKIMSVLLESKEWVKNNLVCDAPGLWFCKGQYPPGLQKVLAEKKDFKQLEDFNSKTVADDAYQRQYFEHLSDPEKAKRRAEVRARKQRQAAEAGEQQPAALTKDQIKDLNKKWQDSERKDGRGPMWWAHEHGRPKMISLLKSLGVMGDSLRREANTHEPTHNFPTDLRIRGGDICHQINSQHQLNHYNPPAS
ncbi:hypothetical protein ACHAXN_005670 [Cyclotella atomus]